MFTGKKSQIKNRWYNYEMKLRVGGEGTYEYLSTLVETLNFRFLAIVARGKSRRNGRADWWSKRENQWSVLFVEVLAKRRVIIKKKKKHRHAHTAIHRMQNDGMRTVPF